MTTPQEEHYALIQARQFLVDLMDPKKTRRVPKYVREEASARVKHFPIVSGHIEPHDETGKRLKEIAEIDRKYRVFERLEEQ